MFAMRMVHYERPTVVELESLWSRIFQKASLRTQWRCSVCSGTQDGKDGLKESGMGAGRELRLNSTGCSQRKRAHFGKMMV